MKRTGLAAIAITALAAAVAATAATDRTHDSAEHGCNIRLKGLKTLSDPQRKLVNLHPKNTTVTTINALTEPQPTPKTRSTGERGAWSHRSPSSSSRATATSTSSCSTKAAT